jgi:hypothetical protein
MLCWSLCSTCGYGGQAQLDYDNQQRLEQTQTEQSDTTRHGLQADEGQTQPPPAAFCMAFMAHLAPASEPSSRGRETSSRHNAPTIDDEKNYSDG